ncbi:MAG: pyridoxal phosphate-dependent aminotransferase [Propionibacteriaceae bacterium]|jgi:aminotransferase|nr:pyridoxal phosphate-dependent aminotransferase [Propionibacteriaceae bacterium]
MPALNHRAEPLSDSWIRSMTQVSRQHEAIDLAQGFPDHQPPQVVLDELARIAHDGPHQYAISCGSPRLREALARKQEAFRGTPVDPEREIVVTCGATEAMLVALLSVVNPGDKVAIFTPYYENFGPDSIIAGATPVYIPLREPTFEFDADEVEAAFKKGAKALILCNPSNPSGRSFTHHEMDVLAALAQKYDAWVITDEVYEHIVYPPHEHISMAALPGMWDRTITCSSLSKTYSMTGWRIGYLIGPPAVVSVAKKIHDFVTVGASSILQEAATPALDLPPEYYASLQETYIQRRDLFLNGLDDLKVTTSRTEPEGGYYVLVDIADYGYDSDEDFCVDLAEKVGVGAVPGSMFFHEPTNHLIRLNFARDEAVLTNALNRLSEMSKLRRARF